MTNAAPSLATCCVFTQENRHIETTHRDEDDNPVHTQNRHFDTSLSTTQ